jgi:hypothetical protein
MQGPNPDEPTPNHTGSNISVVTHIEYGKDAKTGARKYNDNIIVILLSTDTHYFLLYCFYHADDLTHENDLEGCLVIVESKTKKLLGMITVAHFDFYSYAVENRLQGRNGLDGKL